MRIPCPATVLFVSPLAWACANSSLSDAAVDEPGGQGPGPDAAGAGGATAGTGGSSAAGGSGAAGGFDAAAPPRPAPTTGASFVYIDGYRLMVGKKQSDSLLPPSPYAVKGVSWSPTGIGEKNGNGYAALYTEWGDRDAQLVFGLSANTVKTYDAFETNANGTALLDKLYAGGVMVIMNVFSWYGSSNGKAYLAAVNAFKNHPAILMWLVGNEFNYNKLYGAPSLDAAFQMVNTAIDDIHAADPDHPVAVGYGEIPSPTDYARISKADVWSLNLYPMLDLSSRFNTWLGVSKKPMLVGEYGADAYNTKTAQEDQASQASATQQLTQQIQTFYSAFTPTRPVLGGCIYELADEWWKDPAGSADTHDNGGFANAVYPDGMANEEWWGLATVQRTPRTAYFTLKDLYASQ